MMDFIQQDFKEFLCCIPALIVGIMFIIDEVRGEK